MWCLEEEDWGWVGLGWESFGTGMVFLRGLLWAGGVIGGGEGGGRRESELFEEASFAGGEIFGSRVRDVFKKILSLS